MKNQVKTNPYTFNKKAWHCKLFKWCYGVEPSKAFPTMCPYFWSWIGTIIIFPFILLAKVLRVPSKSIGGFISNQISACEEYSQKRRDKKYKKQREAFKIKMDNLMEYMKVFVVSPIELNAVALRTQIKKNKVDWEEVKWYYTDYVDTKGETYKYIHSELSPKYNALLFKYDKKQKQLKEEKIKQIQTNFNESKFIKPIFTLISLLVAGAGIVGFGYGLYVLIVKCVIPAIIPILIVITSILIILLIAFLISKITTCWGDAISDGFKTFINWFKPLLKMVIIFKWMFEFIKLFGKTVYSIYKKQCPLITWVD